MKVLLIEDQIEFAELAKGQIERRNDLCDMECVVLDRMERALKEIHSSRYDVVVLDLTLPDSVGFETVNRINEISQIAPIVILTGDGSPDTVMRCLKNGARDFIYKSEDMQNLQHAVICAGFENQRTKRLRYRMIGQSLREAKKALESITG